MLIYLGIQTTADLRVPRIDVDPRLDLAQQWCIVNSMVWRKPGRDKT